MLVVTNRGGVYVLIKGKTVELEVGVPTELANGQGEKLIDKGVCIAYVEGENVTAIAEATVADVKAEAEKALGEKQETIDTLNADNEKLKAEVEKLTADLAKATELAKEVKAEPAKGKAK